MSMNPQETDLGIINVSEQTAIRLGRVREDNDLVLPHPAVSAHHARLDLRSDGTWWVVDLRSDHGTYVNNQRVGPEGLPVTLEQDTLWVAPYALRLSPTVDNVQPHPAHLRLDAVNLQRRVDSRILLDLHGTPLSFRPGEFSAIVGGSGAGKSTLLKALLGMDTIPEKGRSGDVYFNNQLLIHGSEVRSFNPLNTIVGYVPQQDDSLHFQLSAREVLDYTARLRFSNDLNHQERFERVKHALNTVKLDREELQTKPISRLSGGQRKRVNLAMELVAEPRILFLDEPTSGLDPGLDLEMMNLLRGWALGMGDQDPKTIILITHATENVRLCDFVVFMGGVISEDQERGGVVVYFGPPGDSTEKFFERDTFSEIYQLIEKPSVAGEYHTKLTTESGWNQLVWTRSRTPEDIQESQALETTQKPVVKERPPFDWEQTRRQFYILASRYWLLLRRDTGAYLFQLFQGILVALLLWGVAKRDTFTVVGVRSAPTTLFIISIAAAWLGILNATKEIVKERRVFGRERRYGVGAIPYVLSKFAVLGGLGLWQIATLIALAIFRFEPETHIGTFGRALPEALQIISPLEIEWFVTLELMLLAGLAMGLVISAFARSLDQATMLMFPAMLIQILLAGLLFDVGPIAWFSITHWGLQALGNSLNLEKLFHDSGLGQDPVLDMLNFASSGFGLIRYWLALLVFSTVLIALTFWRQSWNDKARIPED
jgi:ABC-type multidrug transport system ATPase subunit